MHAHTCLYVYTCVPVQVCKCAWVHVCMCVLVPACPLGVATDEF